ncbi:MAG: cysteine--tRNA ligase, partial [Flavobacteriales bacterium]|nr:cysteine--tRNA ligase [Flavobacteriales bacterium]
KKETDDNLLNEIMEVLLKLRKNAKENKDWTTADLIRDELNKINVKINDSLDGSSWELKN